MDGDVDVAAEQCVAQGADEHAGAAQGGQRRGRGVAVGGHLDQLDLVAEADPDQVGDDRRLGGGEQGGTGAEAEGGHVRPSGRVTASTASGSSENSSASAAA